MTVTIRKKALRLSVGLTAFVVIIAVFAAWSFGYATGRDDAIVTELQQSECRGKLNAPVTDARDAGQVAYNFALPAALIDDPVVAKALEEATGKTPTEAVVRQEVLTLIATNVDLQAAVARRGDVFARCADGDPDK